MIAVPEQVVNALAQVYGLAQGTLVYFAGGREDSDGVIYHVQGDDSAPLVKILALQADDRAAAAVLEERLRFVHFVGERGVRIVYPLPNQDGSFHRTVQHGDICFTAYRMARAAGRTLRNVKWDAALYCEWGRLIGRMHALSQEYPTWERSVYTDETGDHAILGWLAEWQNFYDWCRDDDVKAAWAALRRDLEALPRDRSCFGFIHNDPHAENLLFDGTHLTLLDFDVANYHWFMTDIAIALQAVLFSQSGGMERPLVSRAPVDAFLDPFLAGYREEQPLANFWVDQLDLFIAYRRTLLFTVMQDWLAQNPEARAMWKEMILTSPPIIGLG
ncbi:MAG: phosphotransferase [Anaerolineae bacterium]|nr:phosphotransferase [Anaerolineae bacterium]